jgi:hypothetical protein
VINASSRVKEDVSHRRCEANEPCPEVGESQHLQNASINMATKCLRRNFLNLNDISSSNQFSLMLTLSRPAPP